MGHAMRLGLAGERTPRETLERLLPTIRNDMAHDSDRIRDGGFDNHARMREIDSSAENAQRIAAFLTISPEKARDIAETDHLFAD